MAKKGGNAFTWSNYNKTACFLYRWGIRTNALKHHWQIFQTKGHQRVFSRLFRLWDRLLLHLVCQPHLQVLSNIEEFVLIDSLAETSPPCRQGAITMRWRCPWKLGEGSTFPLLRVLTSKGFYPNDWRIICRGESWVRTTKSNFVIYGCPHLKGVPDLRNGHVEGSVKKRANHAMENVPGKNAGLSKDLAFLLHT